MSEAPAPFEIETGFFSGEPTVDVHHYAHGHPVRLTTDEADTLATRIWQETVNAGGRTSFDTAIDALYDAKAALRREADELREREDVDAHLQDVIEGLEHDAGRVEEALEAVEE